MKKAIEYLKSCAKEEERIYKVYFKNNERDMALVHRSNFTAINYVISILEKAK